MKNKNMRDLENRWAKKAKEAAKPKQPKAASQKKSSKEVKQAATGSAEEATKD